MLCGILWLVMKFKMVRQDHIRWFMFGLMDRWWNLAVLIIAMFGLMDRWWNLAVLIIAAGYLFVLFLYVVIENLSETPGA